MKRAFIECHECHHLFCTQSIRKLAEILVGDVGYICKECNQTLGLWSAHFCAREVGDEHCDTCKFRFPCFTECAI